MLIAEIFGSRQGEGMLTGTKSVFVRYSGCNLRCHFCDTPYTSWRPEGVDYSVDQVVDRVRKLAADHVVITGGEPMVAKSLPELCHRIHELGRHITIETAGTQFQSVDCDLMSISPKMSNSTPAASQHPRWATLHEQQRLRPDVVSQLIAEYDYQLKFVVDTPADLDELDDYLRLLPGVTPGDVWLMPQGIEQSELQARGAWLEDLCVQRGNHFCPRKHIEWYGNTRGT